MGSMASALLSNHPLAKSITKDQLERIEKGAWYHSIELPDGRVIPGIIPVEALRARMDAFGIPEDLRGKRVLDVGAATGWCSFEMERRGAEVVAVDCVEYDDFRVAQKLLGSKVDYRLLDIDEFTPEALGTFDLILFFGVLYHLRHPLLGLEKILLLARDLVLVESFTCDGHLPEAERNANGRYMEFYETDELGGQIDNWVGPTVNCLGSLCRAAGFVRVELKSVQQHRAGYVCRRKWEDPPAAPTMAAPAIGSAVNNRTNDIVFHPPKDEYICLYFRAPAGVAKEDLRVEIDGFGAPVLTLASHGGERWQANLRTPVGLGAGAHSIRLRLAQSGFSAPATFYCGERPAKAADVSGVPEGAVPKLYRVSNALSESREFFGHRSEYLCCCFHLEGRPEREDIAIEIGGIEAEPSFVGSAEGWGPGEGWQANVKLPAGLPPGTHTVRIRTRGGESSNPMEIDVRPVVKS